MHVFRHPARLLSSPSPACGGGCRAKRGGWGLSPRVPTPPAVVGVVSAISPVEQLPQHVVHGLAVLRSRRRRVALRRLRRRGWIGGGRGGGKIGASGPPPLPQRCAS